VGFAHISDPVVGDLPGMTDRGDKYFFIIA
jgi:hypothetical protein